MMEQTSKNNDASAHTSATRTTVVTPQPQAASTAAAPPPPNPTTLKDDSDDDLALYSKPMLEGTDGGVELQRLTRAHKTSASDSLSESDSDSDDDHAASSSSHRLRLNRSGTDSKSYTPEEERAVLKKLDRRLVLFISLLYLLSFLDRSNIGNARIAGLDTSLNLSSSQYSWLLTGFYICYIGFEWMIMLYRVLPARIYIPLCVLSWGIIASLQSVVKSFGQLLVLRALLGVAEAAFGPGVPFYMSFFYKRSELAYRVGLQISAAPLATSFASSLAWVIVKLSQGGPIESWRMLFLVEGFPSVIAAVFAWYWIPNGPSDARWLNGRERKVAELRVREEKVQRAGEGVGGSGEKGGRGKIDWQEIVRAIKDPKCYLTAAMFFSVNVSFASLPVFLPTIINSMNFSALASQALAAPPYLCAFVVVLAVGYYSDKIAGSRSIFLAGAALLSSMSYAGIAVAGSLHERIGEAGSITIRYICVYGAAMGLFSAVTLIITWTLNNQESAEGKGTGMVMLNLIGQCGPLVGVHLFPKSDGPEYVSGMAVCSAFMGGVAVLAVGLRWWLWRLNRLNDGGGRGSYEMVATKEGEEERAKEEMEETLMGVGRKQDVFRFML